MSATAVETTAKSHSARRSSRNKKHREHDPFLELSDDAIKQTTTTPTPSDSGTAQAESLFAEFVLTPFKMISFLLSCFIVDLKARRWRTAQHAPQPSESNWWWTMSSHEPYQEAQGSTWRPQYSWRRRGIAKMQISDTFQISGRVAVALVAWTILGFLACVYTVRCMYFWIFR